MFWWTRRGGNDVFEFTNNKNVLFVYLTAVIKKVMIIYLTFAWTSTSCCMNKELFSHDTKLEHDSPAKAAKFSILVPSPSISSFRVTAVTAFWASPRFWHPHSQIPSVLGIPFSYYCGVLSIPRYPLGMPKSLVFWSSPPKKFWISRENRKRFRDGFC